MIKASRPLLPGSSKGWDSCLPLPIAQNLPLGCEQARWKSPSQNHSVLAREPSWERIQACSCLCPEEMQHHSSRMSQTPAQECHKPRPSPCLRRSFKWQSFGLAQGAVCTHCGSAGGPHKKLEAVCWDFVRLHLHC